MYGKLKEFLTNELEGIKAAGLYKNERIITTPQRADIKVNAGSDVLNFCANNYLGLSDNQRPVSYTHLDVYKRQIPFVPYEAPTAPNTGMET